MTTAEIISRIPSLNDNDHSLLSEVFGKFDNVAARFDSFTQLPPLHRIPKAVKDLAKMPRSGWLRLDPEIEFRDVLSTHQHTYNGSRVLLNEDVPASCESIAEHLLECEELYIKLFSLKPHLSLGQAVAKFHDIGEAAFADFTPFDDITRDDKKRLEWIAVNLLTEDRHAGNLHALHIYNCFMIYERDIDNFEPTQTAMLEEIRAKREAGQVKPHQERFVKILETMYSQPVSPTQLTAVQVQVKDIDLLQMVYRAHRIWQNEHYGTSIIQAQSTLKDFWDYVEARLQTEECRLDFVRLKTSDDSIWSS